MVPKAVLGTDLAVSSRLRLGSELLLNGFGASQPERYPETAGLARVALGEQVTLGSTGLAIIGGWQVHPLLDLSFMFLTNPRDRSALGFAGLSYSISDNTVMKGGLYFPVSGRQGVEGEYALYPTFAFVELKAVI